MSMLITLDSTLILMSMVELNGQLSLKVKLISPNEFVDRPDAHPFKFSIFAAAAAAAGAPPSAERPMPPPRRRRPQKFFSLQK